MKHGSTLQSQDDPAERVASVGKPGETQEVSSWHLGLLSHMLHLLRKTKNAWLLGMNC